jgi:hypothetical protein
VLDPRAVWTLEWCQIVETDEVVGNFRPCDVLVCILGGSSQLWPPTRGGRKRARGSDAPAGDEDGPPLAIEDVEVHDDVGDGPAADEPEPDDVFEDEGEGDCGEALKGISICIRRSSQRLFLMALGSLLSKLNRLLFHMARSDLQDHNKVAGVSS